MEENGSSTLQILTIFSLYTAGAPRFFRQIKSGLGKLRLPLSSRSIRCFFLFGVIFISLSFINPGPSFANKTGIANTIIRSHPRILFNSSSIDRKLDRIKKYNEDLFQWLILRVKHDKIPVRLEELRDYIYKYGFLYQATGDTKWAAYVKLAAEQIPDSLQKYGGANNGYAYALEGLSVAYDWCHDYIEQQGMVDRFLSLINDYYKGNRKNMMIAPDFHNYAAQAQIAMLLAGIATQWENDRASAYIAEAQKIVEFGGIKDNKNGSNYKVIDSIKYVDGSCSWEGPTYGRRHLFAYVKYVESIRSATNGKINLWETTFRMLENAGYYILYMMRPDKKYENIGDVNYNSLMYFDINNLSALQAAFQNRYFTQFLKDNVIWMKKRGDGGVWPGRYRSPLVFYLLWFDPTVKRHDLQSLPLSKKFGNTIVIRTGFKPDDTMITYQCGIHWGFHSQLDHGSFTVFKRKPLVIDSGYYDNWRWGKKHNWNYWKRSIAHNTILIHNPDEKKVEWPPNHFMENDGGQRIAYLSFRPPHFATGGHNKPYGVDDLNNRLDEFQMAKVISYESTDRSVYIHSDLTQAYDNKYSGRGSNPEKRVKRFERSFLFLEKRFILVYDSIYLTKKNFLPNWLLHSGNFYTKAGKPQLEGELQILHGSRDAGVVLSSNTNKVRIQNQDTVLTVFPLLPENKLIRRIGGEKFEFWYNGRNHRFAQKNIPLHRKGEDPGAWRLEIEPKKKQKKFEFLNLMIPKLMENEKNSRVEMIEVSTTDYFAVQILEQDKKLVLLMGRRDKKPPEKLKMKTRLDTHDKVIVIHGPSQKGYDVGVSVKGQETILDFDKPYGSGIGFIHYQEFEGRDIVK